VIQVGEEGDVRDAVPGSSITASALWLETSGARGLS
jgi:hypothetical protein